VPVFLNLFDKSLKYGIMYKALKSAISIQMQRSILIEPGMGLQGDWLKTWSLLFSAVRGEYGLS
jgi:hypothetical protein